MRISQCRSCGSSRLVEFLDLGNQYLSDFRADKSKPPRCSLVGLICEECFLVQLKDTADPKDMYHDNYGFKSGISESIKNDLKEIVDLGLTFNPKNWLDIASNDGTLLSFVPKEIRRTGIDPVGFLCKEAEQHADTIINDYFNAGYFTDTQFDVITSISCFYDMDNPNGFVGDVAKVLAKDGTWIIQQNYLLPTLQLGAVDNFCHEHLEYYTLLSLEPLLARFGLEVIDVSTSMVNGGSIRTVVAHKGRPIQDSVEQQRTIEMDARLDKIETYQEFSDKALYNIQQLQKFIAKEKKAGKSFVILAASTRGSTIWQCAGLTPRQIDYAVERNPQKVGKYFSAIGVRIESEEKFRKDQPDYAIIGPWFFGKEIIDREKAYLEAGGQLISPLPQLGVFRWQN